VVGAQIVNALQTITSRTADPVESLVVSVTEFHAGSAYNVIAEEAVLRGTIRSFDPAQRKLGEEALKRIATGIAASLGGSAEVKFMPGYPATRNHNAQLDKALAKRVSGAMRSTVVDAGGAVGREVAHRGSSLEPERRLRRAARPRWTRTRAADSVVPRASATSS